MGRRAGFPHRRVIVMDVCGSTNRVTRSETRVSCGGGTQEGEGETEIFTRVLRYNCQSSFVSRYASRRQEEEEREVCARARILPDFIRDCRSPDQKKRNSRADAIFALLSLLSSFASVRGSSSRL